MMGDRLHRRTVWNWVAITVFVCAALLLLVFHFPQAIGAEGSYVVVSDSMEPTFSAGDLIVVQSVSPGAVTRGDVITYRKANGVGRTTHRVTAVERRDGSRYFRTKGDANENPDPEPVSGDALIGTVWFVIPYAGYVVTAAQRPLGIALLVLLPAAALVVTELRDLLVALDRTEGDEGD